MAQLIEAGIAPTQARQFADPLATLCPLFAIDTPVRQAMFVAQCAHESAGFAALEESLFYRSPQHIADTFPHAFKSAAAAAAYASKPGVSKARELANRAYAGVGGNGNEASGDGWRYRGRGLIQLSLRDNYLMFGKLAARDWIANPDEVVLPHWAVVAACLYWKTNGCNELADASDVDAVTRKINPGMAGRAARRQKFAEAVDAFRV